MSRVLVAGGGASGMFAAIHAARCGHEALLFERNEKLGKKLFITGKGRCNLTNACGTEELLGAAHSNARFLYSSFYGYGSRDVMDFFEGLGVRLKVERGNRVFPVSDHSSDVIRALERELSRLGVKVFLNARVERALKEGDGFSLMLAGGKRFFGDSLIIATGGMSYPSTGSTGDGYRLAKEFGHHVTPLSPGLVPMEAREPWARELQGLSLKNVSVSVLDGEKRLYEEFGEMLFTHYGVSGPLILSASSRVGRRLKEKVLELSVDLKPALSEAQLDQRLLRDFEENKNRQFKNALGKLFPAKLIPVMLALGEIPPDKRVNAISREERRRFARQIKDLRLTLTGLRGFSEAVITQGGVSVKEIHPKTMESKKIPNLYVVGEALDVDAATGGYNLQIAWSTAYAAARAIR